MASFGPGYVARRVNSVAMGCPGVDELRETCDVARLDNTRARLSDQQWTELHDLLFSSLILEGQPELALVRADLVQGETGATLLDVTEVWQALTSPSNSGVFVRLREMATVCPQPPCESIRERKLNSALAARIGQIDFTPSEAVREEVDLATSALMSADGVIIAGDRFTVQTPAQTVRARTATNVYMRIPPAE